MNKKGLVLKEVIVTVVAVLCIILLGTLLWRLSGIVNEESDRDKAETVFKQLVSQINALNDGEVFNYIFLAPTDWYLVYYDVDEISGDSEKNIPDVCKRDNCLCVCPGTYLYGQSPFRGYDRGGFPDYFYYSDTSLDGLTKCERANLCEAFDNVRIENSIDYKVWKGILNEERNGPVNWISFSDFGRAGNDIQLSKSGGEVTISEIDE